MIIWGGGDICPHAGLDGGQCGDGAAYNPTTSSWRPISNTGAPSPRENHTAVWTGTEMIIWGGYHYVAATGGVFYGDGAAYNPSTDSWRPISSDGAPSPRAGQTAAWTGTEMLIWGGCCAAGSNATLGDGAAYNPATNTWRPLPVAGAPSPRHLQMAAWTGSDLIIWGGDSGAGTQHPLGDGAVYHPSTNTWSPMSNVGAPAARSGSPSVWDGREMLIWAGGTTSDEYDNGGRYDPVSSSWSPMNAAGGPFPCNSAPAVWTGSQVIVYGCSSSLDPNDAPGGRYNPPAPAHDQRYFPQTGFRIDNDTIWDYFQHRGGVTTFGYPTSRTFRFQGFTVQFFQRRIVQLAPDGTARQLNLLDPGLLPYTSFNGSTFPAADPGLVASAPDPTNQPGVLAWVQEHAPDSVAGAPVDFFQAFSNTVSAGVAFPNGGGNTGPLAGIDLEMWGVPTSEPMVDPTNHNFIYQRWQRGIMHYDASCGCTQGILLGDYLQDILTGQHLPADLAQEAPGSPLLNQYDPNMPQWVHDASRLPDTDLTYAFVSE